MIGSSQPIRRSTKTCEHNSILKLYRQDFGLLIDETEQDRAHPIAELTAEEICAILDHVEQADKAVKN